MEFQKEITAPCLQRKLNDNRVQFVYPLQSWQVMTSSEVDEKDKDKKYTYLVVIKCLKFPGVKYILAEDDQYIYIQYGFEGCETVEDEEDDTPMSAEEAIELIKEQNKKYHVTEGSILEDKELFPDER